MKADCSFKIPSKTFLVGEYAVLFGGDSLVLTHKPFFECLRGKQKSTDLNSSKDSTREFHKDSPAARLMNAHGLVKDFDFIDPHFGGGGFGGSTAEVVASLKGRADLTTESLLSEYIDLETDKNETAPSGADLCSQWVSAVESNEENHISDYISEENKETEKARVFHFNKDSYSLEKRVSLFEVSWPFKDVSVLIYKRPSKVKTHLHLKNISKDRVTYEKLISISKAVKMSFIGGDFSFFKGLDEFSKEQEHLSLIDPLSSQEVQSLKRLPSVVTARACGAFGGDVVLVFSSDKENLDKLNQRIVSLNFNYKSIGSIGFDDFFRIAEP